MTQDREIIEPAIDPALRIEGWVLLSLIGPMIGLSLWALARVATVNSKDLPQLLLGMGLALLLCGALTVWGARMHWKPKLGLQAATVSSAAAGFWA